MGKTLEEIDYVFATGEAKERLRLRFEQAAHQTGFMDKELQAGQHEHVEMKNVEQA